MAESKDKHAVEHRHEREILSVVSHQMRAPLAAMKGYITLVTDGAYGEINADVREALGKVQSAANGLIGLIDTLLEARRVDEGWMEYNFEKTDLVPFIADIVDSIMPLAKEKRLSLTVDCGPGPVYARADAAKFRLVVHNLIDNAIKYTPAGFVAVTLTVKDARAMIAVSDSGCGMTAAVIPHVFEEFVRADQVKKEIRGTGLGLYIAKKITDAHGGTLTAESPGEGKGSTFTVAISAFS